MESSTLSEAKVTRKRVFFASLSGRIELCYQFSMPSRSSAKPETKREQCTLSMATIRYLEVLSMRGTHGTSVPGVMTTLIEEGIRNAIREKFLEPLPEAGPATQARRQD